jgi:hypothetical protein
VTRLRAGRPKNRGSIPGRGTRFSICEFSSSRSGVAEDCFFRDMSPRHCVIGSRHFETARWHYLQRSKRPFFLDTLDP